MDAHSQSYMTENSISLSLSLKIEVQDLKKTFTGYRSK